ncbi:MAG: Ig-like domain-containing protein [Paracoccaceae bacterium]|nr:Ig-like domain-containing protein [Paracoccaceae bacterium]
MRVTDVNEAPVAAAFATTGDKDTVISGALTALDPDGDTLTFTEVAGPANGTLIINANGSFQFTPVADFTGTDSFTFRASDGTLSDTATATITVNPEPVDPTAPDEPTTGDDTLIGTPLNDILNALAGNDTTSGQAGDDLLIGGGGNDNIKGASGDDRLRGNGGDDTLKGGGGNDNIKGNSGADVIWGNGGDDTIKAGGGNDNVKGGGGADVINGGGGADWLNGGGGNDTIAGKGGDDTLKGNGGADVFQFRTSDRNDTIADFRQGQDKIQIQNGVRTFEGLDIEQDGRDVLIGFGVGQVRIVTDNAGAFDESDFIF